MRHLSIFFEICQAAGLFTSFHKNKYGAVSRATADTTYRGLRVNTFLSGFAYQRNVFYFYFIVIFLFFHNYISITELLTA